MIGVGVGPGDPELLTLKAVRVLSTAGRVFVPVLDPADTGRAEATLAAHVPDERIERLVFSLAGGSRERYWAAAGARVAGWLRDAGGTAAFATIGDPHLYSTFGYLAGAVRELLPGVSVATVPGITAMQALAAASGVPLAEGRERLVLLPLHGGVDGLGEVLASGATTVVYKGYRHLPEIASAASAAGRDALYGTHLGLPDERTGPLSTLDGEAPYLSTVLIPARRA
ncbi:MAG TPA: precorrin-2 C(20)-methyltransferase [Rugosimonospora sp.]|nr:precorrin-2 C(20)-methyltransferase [Rugosimonospora sp.]